MADIKKIMKKGAGILYRIVICAAVLTVVYFIMLLTVFDTFHVPSRSMTPTIKPGDRGIINKLKLGGRIFDIYAAAKGGEYSIMRLPGYGRLEKGDIVVFNGTFRERSDSLEMNLSRYYCKRAVAVAGDTLEIRDGFYKVRGYDGIPGIEQEQRNLRGYMTGLLKDKPDTAGMPGWFNTIPYDSIAQWNLMEFGPMLIPGRNTTVKLDRLNFRLYRKYIAWETGQSVEWRDGKTFIGNREAATYTFTENYFFAAGDHVIDSQDSRYWGLVPEKFIVGVKL